MSDLVQKVNWLNTFDEYRPDEVKEPQQAELLRRMLLSVVNDVRAVLVKLAYRVQRLRLLKNQEGELRERVAMETLDVFAPLANRLGLGQLKWELEDLAFRYLNPDKYRGSCGWRPTAPRGKLSSIGSSRCGKLEAHRIRQGLRPAQAHYSIYRKMLRKHWAWKNCTICTVSHRRRCCDLLCGARQCTDAGCMFPRNSTTASPTPRRTAISHCIPS